MSQCLLAREEPQDTFQASPPCFLLFKAIGRQVERADPALEPLPSWHPCYAPLPSTTHFLSHCYTFPVFHGASSGPCLVNSLSWGWQYQVVGSCLGGIRDSESLARSLMSLGLQACSVGPWTPFPCV